MAGWVLLSLAAGPDGWVGAGGSGPVGPGARVFSALAAAFFAWRVTRGGRASRFLLIISAAAAFAATAFAIAPRFGPMVLVGLAACATQLALLLSPAAYRRTRPRGWDGSAGWTRVGPPLALLLLGLLAGLVVTLLGLSHLGAVPPGCDDGGVRPARALLCSRVADGYPLRWLGAGHGALVVHWPAMLKDLAEYGVLSEAVLYGCWLGPRSRERRAPGRWPAAAVVASALGALALSAVTGGFPLTWVSAGHDSPLYRLPSLLADTAVWTVAGLGGWIAVRTLAPVRPAGGGV